MKNSEMPNLELSDIHNATDKWATIDDEQKLKHLNNGSVFTISKGKYETMKRMGEVTSDINVNIHLYFGLEKEESSSADKLVAYLINSKYDNTIDSTSASLENVIKVEMENRLDVQTIQTNESPPVKTSNATKDNSAELEQLMKIVRRANHLHIESASIASQAESISLQATSLMSLENQDIEAIKSLRDNLDEILEPRSIVFRSFNWLVHGDKWLNSTKKEKTGVQVFVIPSKDFDRAFNSENTKDVCIFFGIKDYKDEGGNTVLKNEIEALLCARGDELRTVSSESDFFDTFLFGDISSPCPPLCPPVGETFNLLRSSPSVDNCKPFEDIKR